MTSDELDPITRRRVLAASGTVATTMGLAGCSGGDGGDGSSDGSGDGGGGSDGGSSDGSNGGGSSDGSSSGGGSGGGSVNGLAAVDVDGNVTKNTVDGVEVADHQSYEGDGHSSVPDGAFALVVTIENTGNARIEPLGYTYELSLYDDSDSTLNSGYSALAMDYKVDSGATGQLVTWGGRGTKAATVARYELAVTCDGSFADGKYCE